MSRKGKSLHRRTDRLEEEAHAGDEVVEIAVQLIGEEDTVRGPRGEHMTPEEFHRRYPSGVCILFSGEIPEPDYDPRRQSES